MNNYLNFTKDQMHHILRSILRSKGNAAIGYNTVECIDDKEKERICRSVHLCPGDVFLFEGTMYKKRGIYCYEKTIDIDSKYFYAIRLESLFNLYQGYNDEQIETFARDYDTKVTLIEYAYKRVERLAVYKPLTIGNIPIGTIFKISLNGITFNTTYIKSGQSNFLSNTTYVYDYEFYKDWGVEDSKVISLNSDISVEVITK